MDLAERTRRRINRRILPFLFLLYVVAFLDRINVGFAGLDMTRELGFSNDVFGFGSGIFFVGYVLLEIPGTLLVELWSARKWIARIMISWGLVAALTGMIHTPAQFYGARFLLGVAEAGFFPGVIVYLTHWYREEDRARAISVFMSAIPLSQVIGAPLSGWLMKIHWLSYSGWRWLLILEGAPAIVLGIVTLFYLTDRPQQARWLPDDERDWITRELERDKSAKHAAATNVWRAFAHRDVVLLTLIYFLGATAQYGFGLWLPKIIQSLSGLNSFQTSLLTAIPYIAAWPAMLFIGWNSDRTGERRAHTAACYIACGLGLAGTIWAGHNIAAAVAMFSLAAIGVNGRLPAFWPMPSRILAGTAAAASIGAINCVGNLGGFVGPYVVGFLSNHTGGSYATSILFLSAGSLLGAALVFAVRPTRS